jgi:predicted solute-binding protein
VHVFIQRYKHDVTAAQKEALKALFKAQYHHQITPEV